MAEDEDEPQVVGATGEGGESGVLTETQTSRELIQMFNFSAAQVPGTGSQPDVRDNGEERLSTVEEASLSPGVLSCGGWSMDRENFSPRLLVSPSVLQPLVMGDAIPDPAGSATTTTSSVTTTPIVASTVYQLPGPTTLRPRIMEASQASAGPVPPAPVPVLPPRPVVTQPGGVRVPGVGIPARGKDGLSKDRRRSQSNEGLSRVSTGEAARARLEDRMFELSSWIRTRRSLIATRLISVEETIVRAGGPGVLSPQWINEELQFVLRTLEDTEKSEMEVWKLVARLESPAARHLRTQEWGHWFQQVMAKAGTIRGSLAQPAEASVAAPAKETGVCQRRGGFLE